MIVCGLIEWKLTCAGFVIACYIYIVIEAGFVIACYIYIVIEVQLSRDLSTLNGVPFEFWMFAFSSQTVATCTTSGTVECFDIAKIYHSMYVMSRDLNELL